MDSDSKKLDDIFRTMTARKISIISRLCGLDEAQIEIMRMRWLENKTDVQICMESRFTHSQATLTRRRNQAKARIIDAMDLYGISDFESFTIPDIFDYSGLFYKAQDELVRFFIHHNGDETAQKRILSVLRLLNSEDNLNTDKKKG